MLNQTVESLALKQALIARCALGIESVALIESAEHTLNIDFVEAALRLGLITQQDLAACRPEQTALVVNAKVKPTKSLQILSAPESAHSERIRVLRTELLLRHEESARASFMAVLSPCAGEGRSMIAAELAISLAQLHRPTLLIDADLRRPTQHVLFAASNQRGLSNAIIDGADPSLHSVEGVDSLSLLTAGAPPVNPLELLSDGRFERLVKVLRRKYTYVVFDTAPIDDYADGLTVANLAGHALIVSRAHHTSQRSMNNLLRRLRTTQSQMLGAVINYF